MKRLNATKWRTAFVLASLIIVAALICGCAGARKSGDGSGRLPQRASLWCGDDMQDDGIAEEFRLWLTSDFLADLTPGKLTAAALDTVACRLQLEECDPEFPEEDNVVMLSWRRDVGELAELSFDVLRDELSAVLDTGVEYEILVERVDTAMFDAAGLEKHFAGCGGVGPAVIPVVSLAVAHRLGVCLRHNIFAFARTGGGYKLMGAHIRNNDGFVVAMYRDGSADLYLARGALCFDRDDFDCAVEMYDRVIDMTPENVPLQKRVTAHTLRGIAFYHKEEYAKAAEDWSRVIELSPYNSEAYEFRASAYQSLGEFEKAAEDAESAIRLDPSPAAYNIGANAYAEMGNYEKALEYYGISLDMEEGDSMDREDTQLYNLSLLYAFMGDDSKADSLYGEVLRIRSNYPGAYHGYEDDIKQYDRYVERYPENALLRYHRGVVYVRMGNMEKAAADFKTALRLDQEHELAKKRLEETEEKPE